MKLEFNVETKYYVTYHQTFTSPDQAMEAIRNQLMVAQAIWPELSKYQLVEENTTKTEGNETSTDATSAKVDVMDILYKQMMPKER